MTFIRHKRGMQNICVETDNTYHNINKIKYGRGINKHLTYLKKEVRKYINRMFFLPGDICRREQYMIRHKASGHFVAGFVGQGHVQLKMLRGKNGYYSNNWYDDLNEHVTEAEHYVYKLGKPYIAGKQYEFEAFEDCWVLTDDVEFAMQWDSPTSLRSCFTSKIEDKDDDMENFIRNNPDFEIVKVQFSKPVIHSIEVHCNKGKKGSMV